jgi:N-dimethylarginine dimethylaminohydrolase
VNTRIYSSATELKGFSFKNCPAMPLPSGALMCPPTFYDVTEARNPFMAASLGKVDKPAAQQQWEGLKAAFESLSRPVRVIEPVSGQEDMVFSANQTLTGLTRHMEKVCVLSQMRHPARRGEVSHFERWFKSEGYRIVRLKDPAATFEGMGDCLWHPGKRLLWGGHGFRTDPEVYDEIAVAFEAPVLTLKLVNERFYHLSTCFCPLTQEAVLVYPSAFSPDSLELILRLFPIVLAAEEREATERLACCAGLLDSTVLMQKGAATAARHIRAIGLTVLEVETSEFIKSGSSVANLRMHLY